ncbi:ligase-associated DNA damage response DEXH box helicase [Rhodospirillum sp. A1_3_36]|uniref:ligase-associated DNA damage response DEXH box helicase n=1 Tax=Rhodospirillum sp. A1_3_36 TaxID=3391666 RepID=UPI0039A5641D
MTQSLPLLLPAALDRWFVDQGWALHGHQRRLITLAAEGRSCLLIAPTGGGKTLAGFLPSLVELSNRPRDGLHTLYISPLKALAQDVHRNLARPIAEAGLPVTHETRTGDTPAHKRKRQREKPPNLLLTTPESLALMLSYPDAGRFFGKLHSVIIDELHALAGTKRGELLSLGLSHLRRLSPGARMTGLSATVAHPRELAATLGSEVETVVAGGGAAPVVGLLDTGRDAPWGGHMALYALPAVYREIKAHGTTLIFVNTRATAELVFQELWRLNEDCLAIALHHGSLNVEQRRKVEAAMAEGRLRAVVCTSSLDLGIDWAGVDLVIQIGAPKGSARLIQRIGRANHRLDLPSQALLAPGNRFEVLECLAAMEAVAEGDLDGDPPRPGGLDVLAQHVLGLACGAPQDPDVLYGEVVSAPPYAGLDRGTFDRVVGFVRNGGYALGVYEQYRRLETDEDGRFRAANATVVRQYRQNVGTIVEAPMLRVKLRRGRVLGEVEEWFILALVPGDTFVFAGELLRFEGVRDMVVEVTRASGEEPKVPAYMGGRLPLSTLLADRVMGILADPERRRRLPGDVRQWLDIQRWRSALPGVDRTLVETFPRGGRHFLVAYCFAGRNAHQTLGLLLTRRLQRRGARPLGFVASDYAIALWCARPFEAIPELFDEDMLGDDLEEWLAESPMIKRVFRSVSVIAGLIHRRHGGDEKTTRQVTVNSDLIFDVLQKYEPDHILLRAARQDALGGLIDIGRLAGLLQRMKGRIQHRSLARVSPLAVPVLLDIGRENVSGGSLDDLLGDAAAEALIAEATEPDANGMDKDLFADL